MNRRQRFRNNSTGVGRDCASGCSRCREVVGIVKAGKAVGNNLRSGLSGCLGGLLISKLFGLSLGSSNPNSQIMLGFDWQSSLSTRDNKHFLKLIEVRGRPKLDQRI